LTGTLLACGRRECRLLLVVCQGCRGGASEEALQEALCCSLCRQKRGDAAAASTSGQGAAPSSAIHARQGCQGPPAAVLRCLAMLPAEDHAGCVCCRNAACVLQGSWHPSHFLGCAAAGAAAPPAASGQHAGGRKLRILCLHGFRQTAKQFQVGAWEGQLGGTWRCLRSGGLAGVLVLQACLQKGLPPPAAHVVLGAGGSRCSIADRIAPPDLRLQLRALLTPCHCCHIHSGAHSLAVQARGSAGL
jgi:hypothetical protein